MTDSRARPSTTTYQPDEDTFGVGTWVREDVADGEWHRSVTFNGYVHGLHCDRSLDAADEVSEVDLHTDSLPVPNTRDGVAKLCGQCWGFWELEQLALDLQEADDE